MDSDIFELVRLEILVTTVLSMLASAGGIYFCWVNRRLSTRLVLLAAGFVGLFVATGFPLLALMNSPPESWLTLQTVANPLCLVSYLLVVAGLGSVLNDFRRQLALALEPKHGRD